MNSLSLEGKRKYYPISISTLKAIFFSSFLLLLLNVSVTVSAAVRTVRRSPTSSSTTKSTETNSIRNIISRYSDSLPDPPDSPFNINPPIQLLSPINNIRIRRTFYEEQQDFKRHEFYPLLRRSISDPSTTLSDDPQCLTRFDLYRIRIKHGVRRPFKHYVLCV